MHLPTRRVAVSTLLVLCVALASACGDGGEDDATTPAATSGQSPDGSSPTPTTSPTTSTSPSSPATSKGPVWTSFDGPLQRCGPQPPSVLDAPFDPVTLRDPSIGRIPAVRLGSGPVVVVLLHQTDGNGFCGWLPFMPAAADAGLTVLAVDLCGYGRATCRADTDGTFTDADQTDPVELALRYARTTLHAERVVVAGASMGGSVALMSAATLPGIAAAVDLSGPVEWTGMDVVRRGRALDVPVLLAMATSEGPEEAAGAQEIVANAPAGSRLLTPDEGHGYVLLTDDEGGVLPLARDVLDWILKTPGG